MNAPAEPAGELGFLAAAALLRDLALRRTTGQLVAWRGETVKKVVCKNGFVVYASSNEPADRLGDVLLARGMITRDQYEESASQVLATGRKQGTVLVQIGALQPKDLFRGLIAQVREIVLSLFAWDEGGWRVVEGLPTSEEMVTLRINPAGLILEGLGRVAADPRFAERWRPGSLRIAVPPAPPIPVEELDLPGPARHLLAGVAEGLPWPEAVARAGIEERPAGAILYGLDLLGVVATQPRPVEAEAPAAAPARAPEPPDEATRELRAKVAELAGRIGGLSFYQLLGLTPQADAGTIKRAYIALAKEFHPDRFFRGPLADLQETVNTIFMRVNDAYTTLGNPATRAAYDREVLKLTPPERPLGPDQDSRVAQEQFLRGIALLKEGDLWSAIQNFRWAVNLSPQSPRYHTFLGVALLRTKKRLHEAEEHCKTAIALDYNNPQYYVHLGQVYRTGHLWEKARQQFEQALRLDPKHPQALKEIEELKRAKAAARP